MFKKLILGLVLFLGLCALGIILFAKDFEVKITEEMAQQAIDAQIQAGPLRSLGIEVTLKSAKVNFLADNTMKFAADMETNTLGYKHQVDGVFKSGISYRSPRLYLNNISPAKINIETDDETREELDELKSTARKFLKRQIDNRSSEKKKEALNNRLKANSAEAQKTVERATYAVFERVPIYNLNNAGYKGSLASLALKDVQFEQGHAIVTLSPVQALLRTLAILGVILLMLTFAVGHFVIGHLVDKVISRAVLPED
jgi:hypothetical protein